VLEKRLNCIARLYHPFLSEHPKAIE